ncbi:MAG TPA: sigma 54-interacting transcriptional regulator [Verrucomicrobiae bacterium]|jgi:DNA-binding NtrC family response regulator
MKPMSVLLLCLQDDNKLVDSLRQVLEQAQPDSFQLRVETLPIPQRRLSRIFSRIFAGGYPNLIVLSLPSQHVGLADFILSAIRENQADISVLVVLESGQADELNRMLSLGAADFILAPPRPDDLLARVMRLGQHAVEREETDGIRREKLGLMRLIGESATFLAETSKIPKVARCNASVLISGETGTGKEMFARAIHYLSPQSGKPFIPVNCGAIPAELVENELFGHEAGAFTGANSSTRGLIHESDGGTLFLDEIDSLPFSSQVKLLRFLQEKEYRPLGARKACRVDTRVIAASNVEFEEAIRSGRFRSDLYYRLNVIPITLPPLRARSEDVVLLARHRIVNYTLEQKIPPKDLSSDAVQKLCSYHWPGNVRELENIIDRAIILSEDSVIGSDDIRIPCSVPEQLSFKALKAKAVSEFETNYVRRILAANDGNITKAASAAKKNRRAFWQLMHKHRISFLKADRDP